MKNIKIVAKDGFSLDAVIGVPQNARAIVQVVHGAYEDKVRYQKLFDVLLESGYGVIAADHRGHGKSISQDNPRGLMRSVGQLVGDMVSVTSYVHEHYPEMPVYMFAHSMGSMFARIYLQEHDALIEKLIMSGTVRHTKLTPLGFALTRIAMLFQGELGTNPLICYLGDGFQRKNSMVSDDYQESETVEEVYVDLGYYCNRGYDVMCAANWALRKYSKYRCQNPELAIVSMTGEGDPMPGGKRGLKTIKNDLINYGYKNVSIKTYNGLNHEIVNEDKGEVLKDIIKFYDWSNYRHNK